MPDYVAILRNRHSGTGRNSRLLRGLIKRLRTLGMTPRIFSSRDRLQVRLSDESFRNRLRCIVAAGGDGTVADVVGRYPGVPVAVLAMGTENVLAKHLNLPRTGVGVANMIAKGNSRHIDVGVLGERKFTLMATAGLDAEIVHQVHAGRKGNIRKLRYIQPILQSLRTYKYPEMRVYCDDDPQPLHCHQLMIFNLPSYAMRLHLADSARGDDGLLDLRLFTRAGSREMIRYAFHVIRHQHERLPDVESARARRVRIESDEPVPMQTDGDPAGWTPTNVAIQPSALELIVPVDRKSTLAQQEGQCQIIQ